MHLHYKYYITPHKFKCQVLYIFIFLLKQPKRYILYKSPDQFSLQNYECCTMEYIPLLELLQTILENSCLFQTVSIDY